MENPYKKPTPPADGICCESACNPCVWDNYYADLKKWRIAEAKLREQQEQKEQLENKTP